jgi:dTDP-4-amino-4,6-dideoxygalactose transaminase
MRERINVTKTFLPPLKEYQAYVNQIWDTDQLTNQGPLLLEFEQKIKDRLNVRNFHFVGNGTLALQIAIRALGITDGEIITTPFSYVATTSAILWEKCDPVFVDIDLNTFCIDSEKIEAAITEKTKAILAVHVFGNSCEVEKIDTIAKKYKLKVIYDAAHAFGVEHKGKSLLDYGDISICSFHATKLFHTIEGGGLIVKDKSISEKIYLMKKFGHEGDEHFMLGINAKASEFQAAMGICNLKYLEQIISDRKKVFDLYNQQLVGTYKTLHIKEDVKYNYSYYPVVLKSEMQLHKILKKLSHNNIFPRRYFYPSLNTLPYLSEFQSCSISEDIAKRILCLPLYGDLDKRVINKVCEVLLND